MEILNNETFNNAVNKDKEYFWKYDEKKPLKEQDVSRDTIAFLSYLNMEYLLNEKQKGFGYLPDPFLFCNICSRVKPCLCIQRDF